MNRITTGAVVALLAMAGSANAQLMITELFENPQSGTDEQYEYIEIYGCPGMSLDGYAIAAIKGGLDSDDNNTPDGTGGDNIPEIDEAYRLDGYALGSNGFLVLYNDGDDNSLIPGLAAPGTTLVAFSAAHIPSTDTPGNLNGTGSSTYVLVRARANPANFRKDVFPDADFDGKLDFGDEVGPFYGTVGPLAVQPIQRVDELAWSNGGGKEYVADSDWEISDTPGFNPDAVSRLNYFLANPAIGSRTKDDGNGGFEIVSTRRADESFVYGEIPLATLAYDTSVDADGNRLSKAPTDPNATPYDGACDPEPNNPGPNPGCTPNAAGSYYFTDYNIAGFALTPGRYNDGAGLFQIRLQCAQSEGSLPNGFSGQYWRTGDFNMDGLVDCNDVQLIESRAGATLDDTIPGVDPQGIPFVDYKWQNADFQTTLMMLNMSMTDGGGGQNSAAVTQADIDAVEALVAPPAGPCPGDIDANDTTDVFDFSIFASNFGNEVPCGTLGDLDGNGSVDVFDFALFASDFGCDAN